MKILKRKATYAFMTNFLIVRKQCYWYSHAFSLAEKESKNHVTQRLIYTIKQ